ncbi:hypothetical protein [Pseudorhodobacter sp. MZDSW-24AT]|uniref:hypothetical protein n=1 Tax=Pseudorhodobacter sp. MZDSW-24AT TaxID=2052957 RepID=UPI0012FDAF2A|nr:hypothetical protein [Pseudorhodobacter sp. MZDSW-24AT]
MFPTKASAAKTSITLQMSQAFTPKFDALAPKPKTSLTARDVVDMNRAAILRAVQKGYNFSDIAGMMVDAGVKISASTLAHYLRDKEPKDQTAVGAARDKRKTTTSGQKAKAPAPEAKRDEMSPSPRAHDASGVPALKQHDGPAPSAAQPTPSFQR